MMYIRKIAAVFVIILFFFGIVSAYAQEQTAVQATSIPTPTEEVKWIGGDVLSVDVAAGKIQVRYYDYDTDEEKDAQLIVDKETKLENVAALTEIKVGDYVDVDYVVQTDGQWLAKTVTVEKAEEEETSTPKKEGAEE